MKLQIIAFYVVAVGAALLLFDASERASREYAALIALDSPGQATSRASKNIIEKLTFGWYSGAESARADRATLLRTLAQTEREVMLWSGGLAVLVFVSAAVGWWRSRASTERRRSNALLALHLCGCASVFLVIGAVAPLLTIIAFQDLSVIGRVVLSYETKTFIGTIHGLVDNGNWPVAAMLALFSLVIPVTKLSLSALVLTLQARGRYPDFTRRSHDVLHHMGKWSMTDVFVVAILVVFFATSKAAATEAEVGIGLYFFAAHTACAVLASMLAPREPPPVPGTAAD